MSSADQAVATGRKPGKQLFHGWYIIAIGYLSQFGFSTALSSTLGVFFKPMSQEFGWPRSYLSGVRSFESLLGGLAISFLGPLLDRHGTRTVLVIGGIVTGLGIALQGFVGDSVQFFLVRGIVVCLGTAAISNVVVAVAISNWFVRLRGRAMGLSGTGMSTGKIIMAPLITLLMGIWGWREAWVVLGLMVLVLVPIPSALLVRRRPEDMGMRPDGDGTSDSGAAADHSGAIGSREPVVGEVAWKRGEAIRTSAFWLIVVTFSFARIGAEGMALHTIPYLTDIGFSPVLAAASLSILSVFQLIGNLVWGFVAERFPLRYCTAAMFLIEAGSIAMILWMREPATVIGGLLAYGFSLSGTWVLQDMIWANYFGRLSVGTVRGLGMPFLVVLAAGGPLYFGYLYDVTGGYDIPFIGFMVIIVISAALILACRPPQRG